jgi:hypothetical protein
MNKKLVESLKSTVLTDVEVQELISIADEYKAHKDDVDNSVKDVVSNLGYTGTDAETVLHLIKHILDILNNQTYALDIAVALGSLATVTFNSKIKSLIDFDEYAMFDETGITEYNQPRVRGIALIDNIAYRAFAFRVCLGMTQVGIINKTDVA